MLFAGRPRGFRILAVDHEQAPPAIRPTVNSPDVPTDVLRVHGSRPKQLASVPVCAGFGIRLWPGKWRVLRRMWDGVVVGSALVEVLERRRECGSVSKELALGGAKRPQRKNVKRVYRAASLLQVAPCPQCADRRGPSTPELRNQYLAGALGGPADVGDLARNSGSTIALEAAAPSAQPLKEPRRAAPAGAPLDLRAVR